MNTGIVKVLNEEEPNEEFLFACINDFDKGDKKAMMLQAQRYYINDNDILERKKEYIDRNGVAREATNLTNTKLVHPFFRKLVNQKINYLLSREFSVQSDNRDFAINLSSYFNKRFNLNLKNIARDAIINGVAWLQVYYNEVGELRFKRIPAEEIIPFWKDSDHTELSAILRQYVVTEYDSEGQKVEVVKIEYYNKNGVWYYIKGDNGLVADIEKEKEGHFTVNGAIYANWEKIPFIAFKYNADELSLLKLVKSLIDDYDINTSDTSNVLQDIPNSIKVVKNYDGTDKGEFSQNLAIYRTAFVSGDGDINSLETNLDISAIKEHLERLRKDIYEAGSGVDTQQEALGNSSGVALKFKYVDLDNDIDSFSTELKASLVDLIWFIKIDLLNKGRGDYMDTDYEMVFNTDNIINEQEVIENARNSVGIISNETILVNHPWVTDAQAELERLEKEQSTGDNLEMFSFGQELENEEKEVVDE